MSTRKHRNSPGRNTSAIAEVSTTVLLRAQEEPTVSEWLYAAELDKLIDTEDAEPSTAPRRPRRGTLEPPRRE